jgi:hypothetical protein
MDPTKTNGPYNTIHLRKQEDEERQREQLQLVRAREENRGNMMVQGVNIKTVNQKVAEAQKILVNNALRLYGLQKVNVGVNSSDLASNSGLDSKRT